MPKEIRPLISISCFQTFAELLSGLYLLVVLTFPLVACFVVLKRLATLGVSAFHFTNGTIVVVVFPGLERVAANTSFGVSAALGLLARGSFSQKPTNTGSLLIT